MKKALFALILLTTCVGQGSELGDRQHAYKTVTSVVLNASIEPVFGEAVEETIADFFRHYSRFEFDESLHAALKEWAKQSRLIIGEHSLEAAKPFIQAQLLPAVAQKADAVVFAEVVPSRRGLPEDHGIFLSLVNSRTGELIAVHLVRGLDPKRLEKFVQGTKAGLAELVKAIPFGATVARREGYRVILDRGVPDLRKGMQVPAFTIDTEKGEPSFVETGIILITRAEKNLSFGKVIADRRPHEIKEMNKVWVGRTPAYLPPSAVALLEPGREPASEGFGSSLYTIGRPKFGYWGADFGLAFVTINNSLAEGTTSSTGNTIYPVAMMSGELRVTRHWFLEAGATLGASSLSGSTEEEKLNAQIFQLRVFGGYRFSPFFRQDLPSIHFKLGWMRNVYAVDPSSAPILYTTANYEGLAVSTGVDIALDSRIEGGFFMNAILLPSMKESPEISGRVKSSSSWELGLKAIYHLSPKMDAFGRFVFQYSGADFDPSDGARPLVSSSQSTRGLYLGAAYRF